MNTLISLILAAILSVPSPEQRQDAAAIECSDTSETAEMREMTASFLDVLERAFQAMEEGDMEPRGCLLGYCATCKGYQSPSHSSVSCTISGPGWICDGACVSNMGCGGKCW